MKTMAIENGDLVMDRGDIALIDGPQEFAQSLYIALSTFKNEWFQDSELGIDRSKVVGKVEESQIRSTIIEAIGRERRVASIESLSVDKDTQTRKLYVSFRVRTTEGEVLESEGINIAE